MKLVPYIVAAAATFAVPAAAAEAMLPIVVVSSNAPVNDKAAARVVEEVTGAFREAVLRVYARSIYGTGAGFKGQAKVTGAAGLVADTFGELDRTLQTRASLDLGNELSTIQDDFNFGIEVLWVKDRERYGSVARDLAGVHTAALLWQMAGRAMMPKDVADAGDLISEMMRIPLVRASDVPGGVEALRQQGMAAYDWLRETARDTLVPLQVEFSFFATQGAVTVDLRTTVKAADLAIELDPPEPQDVFVGEGLRWAPPQFVKDPPVGRFIFKRTYGKVAKNPPMLHVTFGRLYDDDVTSMAYCNTKCEEEDNTGPRHPMKSAPTIKGTIRVPDTLSGWKRSGMKAAVDAFNGANMSLFVMINDVVFDMTNPRDPQLIENKSRIPVVLRIIDPLNGRHYFDITEGNVGFDYMARYANSRAAYKMNKAIVTKLTELDATMNKQMRGFVGLVKEMLK